MGVQILHHIGLFGWFIVFVLVSLSILLWAILVDKWRTISAMERWSDQFIVKFRNDKGNLLECYEQSFKNMNTPSPLLQVFKVGCSELQTLLDLNQDNDKVSVEESSSLERLLQGVSSEEIMGLEKSLSILATTASVSPLLGLLGTVWGIMESFLGMSMKGSASISAVAPGVATALLTTIIGLLVAIPALIAYNTLQNKINRLESRTNNFVSEFIAHVQLSYARR